MKKIFLILAAAVVLSSVAWADEFFKCRKETYVYDNHKGGTYSDEFYFINNFMVFPHYYYESRQFIFYYKEEGRNLYNAFGEFFPEYIGHGELGGVAYGVGAPPVAIDTKIEEIKYRKTDFYKLLAGEFYRWYLQKEAFKHSDNADFDCLAAFVEIAKIFSKEDLRILRNTIYAKYGYKFKSADLNEIFSKCDWYSPKESSAENIEERFNCLESSLLEVIKLAEK